jgi:uncharacterized protein
MQIIDVHAHFPIAEDDVLAPVRERYVRAHGPSKWQLLADASELEERRWRQRWGFPDPETTCPPLEEQARRWHAEVQRHGLRCVVFLTGGGNELLARAVAIYPQAFVGFAHHSPFDPQAVALLDDAVRRLGLRGYKILAPLYDRPLSDPALYPLWQKAEELGVPVVVHCGVLGGRGGIAAGPNIDPLVLHDVCRAFPTVPFIVPHLGCGYPKELLQLCWGAGNVYVDTSSNHEWLKILPERLSLAELLGRFRESIGAERILFGTDSAWFPRGFARAYLDAQLEAFAELGLSEEERRLILHDNAARLLRLPQA